jgi:hypothetical protein
MTNDHAITFLLWSLGVSIILYFLPFIVAHARRHRQTLAIFCLNLFLGWTLLGWVIALVWACLKEKSHARV